MYNTPNIRYVAKTENNLISHSDKLDPKYKFLYAEVSVALKMTCKHCGKKEIVFLNDKIK